MKTTLLSKGEHRRSGEGARAGIGPTLIRQVDKCCWSIANNPNFQNPYGMRFTAFGFRGIGSSLEGSRQASGWPHTGNLRISGCNVSRVVKVLRLTQNVQRRRRGARAAANAQNIDIDDDDDDDDDDDEGEAEIMPAAKDDLL